MSNNEMVSVSRELLERSERELRRHAFPGARNRADDLRALLAAPPAGSVPSDVFNCIDSKVKKEIQGVYKAYEVCAQPVPPAGVHLQCWSCKADFTLAEMADCYGCCWRCGNEINLEDYVTRLQAELAALREELATAKRNEHNSEVAYKSAIERQEELRESLVDKREEYNKLGDRHDALEQRLADAERRNAELESLLLECAGPLEKHFSTKAWDIAAKIKRKVKPTTEGSSHEQ